MGFLGRFSLGVSWGLFPTHVVGSCLGFLHSSSFHHRLFIIIIIHVHNQSLPVDFFSGDKRQQPNKGRLFFGTGTRLECFARNVSN